MAAGPPLMHSCEVELGEVLRQGKFGDGHLVLDEAHLLLGDLSVQQIPTMRGGSRWRLMPLPITSS